MQRPSRPSRLRRSQGFTLIELMVVIVILGLLVGIVGPNVNRFLIDGRIATAKQQMIQMESAVTQFRTVKKRLPETLDELLDANGDGFLQGKELPKDPWGGEYRYERIDRKKFDILCLGGDGQEGGEDREDRDIRLEDAHKTGDEEE